MNFKMVKSYAMQSSPYPYRILSNCLNTKPITKPAESRIYIPASPYKMWFLRIFLFHKRKLSWDRSQLKDEK